LLQRRQPGQAAALDPADAQLQIIDQIGIEAPLQQQEHIGGAGVGPASGQGKGQPPFRAVQLPGQQIEPEGRQFPAPEPEPGCLLVRLA